MSTYVAMTEPELRAALADRRCIVLFRAQPGARARMPLTRVDVRRPGREPLVEGMVASVSSAGRVRVEDDHGCGGTIAISDALYLKDPL